MMGSSLPNHAVDVMSQIYPDIRGVIVRNSEPIPSTRPQVAIS